MSNFWEIRNIHRGSSCTSTARVVAGIVNNGIYDWPSYVVGFMNNDGSFPEFWGFADEDLEENDLAGKFVPGSYEPSFIGHIMQIVVNNYLVYACVYVPTGDIDEPYGATDSIHESDSVRYYALGRAEYSKEDNLIYGKCAPIEIEASGSLNAKDLISYIETHGIPGEPKDSYSLDSNDWWHFFYAECEDRGLFRSNFVWGELWGILNGDSEINESSAYTMAFYVS